MGLFHLCHEYISSLMSLASQHQRKDPRHHPESRQKEFSSQIHTPDLSQASGGGKTDTCSAGLSAGHHGCRGICPFSLPRAALPVLPQLADRWIAASLCCWSGHCRETAHRKKKPEVETEPVKGPAAHQQFSFQRAGRFDRNPLRQTEPLTGSS